MSKRQENPVYDVPDIFIKNNHGPSDSTVIIVRDATGTIVKTHEVVEKINSVLEQKLGVLNILVESMVPIKVNAQSQEVLVSSQVDKNFLGKRFGQLKVKIYRSLFMGDRLRKG